MVSDQLDGARVADAAVHIAGLLLAPSAALLLLGGIADGASVTVQAALAVYAASMVAMIAASAAYNLAPAGRIKQRLRRLDHALIFAAIAGTYTPFLLLGLPAGLGRPLCAAVWALAALGALLKLAGWMGRPRRWVGLYLGLGWVGLPAIPVLAAELRAQTLWMLGAGAALYTIGAVIHLLDRLPYNIALWHVLVLAAAACHYVAIRGAFTPVL